MAESNKTEKATPKKRLDERKKGNAFQSKDVISIVVLLVGFFLLSKLGAFIIIRINYLYHQQVALMVEMDTLTIASCSMIFRNAIVMFFMATIPIFIAIVIVGIVMTGVQTKFLFSTELLKFKFHRISIIQGFKRLFSLRSIVQLIKSLLKVLVIGWIIYANMKELVLVSPDILNSSLQDGISYMLDKTMAMVYKICLLFVLVAALDYAYQKYDYEKKLRMTKQEIKDEYKQTEGDPFIKGKRKEKHRRMSLNRMIQQVPGADVIVRNPTHFAVALKYDIDKDFAPMVIAKGRDKVAMKIVEAGEKNQVLITENKSLARTLYDSVEINDYIPPELYQVVAELMAWVFSNKDEGKKKA
ncbi:MAG: flagellar biosynthesis protein FlhB [Eubacteriales bacterium]|nr:flagellar biosynthesis protein FlhB [Eubacteriales bacterium]MDD4390117.1 flagellar biosynthesis protein FlhB [Eubacteriales bacterium]